MTAPLLDLDQPIHPRWSDDCPNKLTRYECDCDACRHPGCNECRVASRPAACHAGECCCLGPAEETA